MTAPDTIGVRAASETVEILRRHGHNPSAFLALNSGTEHFRVPGRDGLVAYRPAGRRHLVQLGGVFAGPDDATSILDAFLTTAARQGRRVVAVQLLAADAEVYRDHGFRVNQLGSSYSLDLDAFTLAGKRFMKLRNKISRARRADVEVVEVGVDIAAAAALDRELDDVDRDWLASKGHGGRELAFMVGERGGLGDGLRRVFLARQHGEVIGYLSCSPVYGRHRGWLYDLTRRRVDVPPGVAELLTATAVERFRSEGSRWLHLGLTPFADIAPEHEVDGASSPAIGWTIGRLGRHDVVYPAQAQAAYKRKWHPQLVQPEYIAFQGRPSVRAVWQLLRLTRAV